MPYFSRKVPPRIQLVGNKRRAKDHIGIGVKLLNLTENQASFQRLQQYAMKKVLLDGSFIEANIYFGLSTIKISAPFAPLQKEEEVNLFRVLGPEMYFPWHYTIKLEIDDANIYIFREDYEEIGLPFETVFIDLDKEIGEGPLSDTWKSKFSELYFEDDYKFKIVEYNVGTRFYLIAYSNIPEAWEFLQENPEHPLSNKYEENPPDTIRPRIISPFMNKPLFDASSNIVLLVNRSVNSWESFDKEVKEWLIMDEGTPGGEVACALTKMQLLYEKGIDKHAMDLLFFNEGDSALLVICFVEGVLYLDAPNRKKDMRKDSLLLKLNEEEYSKPWLFSKVWPESFWGMMGKVEDIEGKEFKSVGPEELQKHWKIPGKEEVEEGEKAGVTEITLPQAVGEQEEEEVRFGLFTPEYEEN